MTQSSLSPGLTPDTSQHHPLTHSEDLAEFIQSSPSSYHAANTVRSRLVGQGFTELKEADAWELTPGQSYVVVRDGAVAAFCLPPAPPAGTPAPTFRVIGAHTDSPGFKLVPHPDFTAFGVACVAVEIYGGPLLNSWLDRELRFAGRLVLRDGTTVLAATGPVGRIPQLAIHLDRSVNDGLTLDKQRHTQPVVGLGAVDMNQLLAQSAGVDIAQVVAHDVYTIPAQPPEVFGANAEFLAAPRLDNLASVHAGLCAVEAAHTARSTLPHIPLLVAFDHEEVGSQTRSGASGPFLAELTERIIAALAKPWNYADSVRDTYLRCVNQSICVSSDAGHAVHPNYPDRHNPHVTPLLGQGPLLKLNAQQRYASDATGAGVWAQACAAAGVTSQAFVSNNNVPCGSTIGPLTATRLGMTTVDVGPALLSMHSAREMIAVTDITALITALTSFVREETEAS